MVTGDGSALADGPSPGPYDTEGVTASELADLTIHDASDPSLGLTNIGDVPPDDWAADTGPTRNPDLENDNGKPDPA